MKVARIKIRPDGKGKTFLCDPPHLASVAIDALKSNFTKIREITSPPGLYDGLTIFVHDLFQPFIKDLSGSHDGQKWCLVPYNDNFGERQNLTSCARFCINPRSDVVIPQSALDKLHLQDDEKDMLPILNWLYSFYGSLTGDNTDIFILFTAELLHGMGFISHRSLTHPSEILAMMGRLDHENIRVYENANVTLLNASSLPDVENSCIYNPLTYTPAKNTVIAVRKDYILKSLVCFRTEQAMIMSGLLARFVGEFLKQKATAHVQQIGQDAFQATVAEPTMEEMRRFCGIKAIKTAKQLLIAQRDLAEEHYLRTLAESNTAKIKIDLLNSKFNTQLAILDRDALVKIHDHHKAVNMPAQTMSHKSENITRVGCVVARVTEGPESGRTELGCENYEKISRLNTGELTVGDINENSAVMLNLHISERSSFKEKRCTLKQCFNGANNINLSSFKEANNPLFVLLGGNRAIDVRAILREELIIFGGPRKRASFVIPRGELSNVAEMLKTRCGSLFAVGIFDGEVLFVNEQIKSILPTEDALACDEIISKLTT